MTINWTIILNSTIYALCILTLEFDSENFGLKICEVHVKRDFESSDEFTYPPLFTKVLWEQHESYL